MSTEKITDERLDRIAEGHYCGPDEAFQMAEELLAARAEVERLRAEVNDLRTSWNGIAGGENSFPSDRDGDRMAREQVEMWLELARHKETP